MKPNEAGEPASSVRAPMGADELPKTRTISPAARKLAEHIARRMLPKIEHSLRTTPDVRSENAGAAAPLS
jgi:hypothetical protein